jgi:hypothetical protein
MKQNRQANDQRKFNLAQAEMTRYSPWTGQTGQLDTRDTGSPLEAGVGGAVQGIGLTQSLGGDLGFGGAAAQGMAPQSQGLSLGGQEMAGNIEGMKFGNQLPNIYQSQPKFQNMGLSLAGNRPRTPYGY